ncbi:hypothetical protein MKW98_029884 [Papaver atlanticum]|uniref:Uncharacterized protein n=1 Tax=Papaver atlanticum TaxID=357466 RepID=A0AAD4TIW8_9MAGN|nr:hypothetical protein MKW98_029884 [Papaver atlanticum]
MVHLPSLDAVAKGKDYLIMVTPYSTQHLDAPTFTIAKLPLPDIKPPRKKSCLQKIAEADSVSAFPED